MVFALNGTVTLTFDLVTSKFIGVIYWPWPIFLTSTMTVSHKPFKILSGHGFWIKWYCDLDFDLVTLKFIGVIYWPWPIFLLSTMTVSRKLLRYWADMVFALNGTVTLTFDLVTSKYIGVIYWPWPIFLLSTMTVSHKLIKILSGHGVANGRTDGRKDERHTIIRPKFHFGRIKSETRGIFVKNSLLWDKAAKCTCLQKKL